MLKQIIAATALLIAAIPAVAEVITYDCTIKGDDWVEERLIVSVDTGTKTAMALNGIIKHYYDEPIAANFIKTRSGKYKLRRSVESTESGTSGVRANYEVQLDPSTNKLIINVRFPLINAVERPRGKGACKILKGVTLF